MQILADENIPRMTVGAMVASGHDVRDIRGTADEGLPDDLLWELARSERRILITTDKGFLSRRTQWHYGLLVVALRQPNRMRIHTRITEVMGYFSEVEWPGMSVVIKDSVQTVWRQ